MIKTIVAFGGPAFFSQSGFFEYFLNCFDWLEKSHFCFDHVNRLYMSHYKRKLHCKHKRAFWTASLPKKANIFSRAFLIWNPKAWKMASKGKTSSHRRQGSLEEKYRRQGGLEESAGGKSSAWRFFQFFKI